jgi:hypothetical protein
MADTQILSNLKTCKVEKYSSIWHRYIKEAQNSIESYMVFIRISFLQGTNFPLRCIFLNLLNSKKFLFVLFLIWKFVYEKVTRIRIMCDAELQQWKLQIFLSNEE